MNAGSTEARNFDKRVCYPGWEVLRRIQVPLVGFGRCKRWRFIAEAPKKVCYSGVRELG